MDWTQVEAELIRLANKITRPDIIIGIVRGGIVPARLLAAKLEVKDMYCLTVKKQGSERKVTSEITEPLTGNTVLLVEDMLETGTSLAVAQEYLESLGATVQTAALYIMPQTQAMPDYYLKSLDKVPVFPWE